MAQQCPKSPAIWTTVGVIDALVDRYDVSRIAGVSHLLGADVSRVHRWAHGTHTMTEASAHKAAVLLDVDPGYLLLCLAAERLEDASLTARAREILLAVAPPAALLLAGFYWLPLPHI